MRHSELPPIEFKTSKKCLTLDQYSTFKQGSPPHGREHSYEVIQCRLYAAQLFTLWTSPCNPFLHDGVEGDTLIIPRCVLNSGPHVYVNQLFDSTMHMDS